MAVARADNIKSVLLEQLVIAWKRKWLALAVAWTVCLIGSAGVMLIPQRYEANARVFVDVNGLLAPLLKGLVVETAPQQSEVYLRQTLLSRPNLEQVILLANLGGTTLSDVDRQGLVGELAAGIKVTTESNNLISIAYTHRNPVTAKNVLDALLTVFAEKAANSSRVEMDKARGFLGEQISSYESQLRAAEKRRADFRKKNAIYFNDSGVARPEILKQQVAQIQQQYEEALAGRNALAGQMRQVPQLLDVASAPTVANSGAIVDASPDVRLAQAKSNLASLKLLYTEKHPDVVAAQRSVNDLEGQVAAARKTGSLEGKTQISNPAYEQLRLKLADSAALIPVLKQRLDKAVQDYERALTLSADLPEISARSQDLDRDYDIVKQNYDELVKRRESANLSQAADDRADRTQFRVVDPPQVPIFPAFPNRLELFSLVFALGIVAGGLTPLAMEQVRPTFGSTARLRELGLPVIGAITDANSALSNKRRALSTSLFAAASAGLFLLYGGFIIVLTGMYKGIL